MDERDVREIPEGGLMGLDREVFDQVWRRVAPQGSPVIEPAPPEGRSPAPQPPNGQSPAPQTPEGAPPVEAPPVEDPGDRRLQELVLVYLTDGSVYRDLARRTRRSVGELQELYRQKLRQAKRLSAAYFLRTGVRYWPREVTPVNPPEGFFPALRERYLAEGRLAGRLEALAVAGGEAALGELYADLAQEARNAARAIRAIVERET